MKMVRFFSEDAEYIGSAAHAVKMFCKKHPEVEENGFNDTFEWMVEDGVSHIDDTMNADGTYNDMWWYSLDLEWIDGMGITKDGYYISLVMREVA